MSTTASPSTDPHGFPPPSPPSQSHGDDRLHRAPRRATRSRDDRIIGGVAGGLAEHLGVDPMPVRIAFVNAQQMPQLPVTEQGEADDQIERARQAVDEFGHERGFRGR